MFTLFELEFYYTIPIPFFGTIFYGCFADNLLIFFNDENLGRGYSNSLSCPLMLIKTIKIIRER